MKQALESELEPELEKALADFRLFVHTWSDAAYHRPRTVAARWCSAAGERQSIRARAFRTMAALSVLTCRAC